MKANCASRVILATTFFYAGYVTHHAHKFRGLAACTVLSALLITSCGLGSSDELAVATPIATTAPLLPGPPPTATPPISFLSAPAPTVKPLPPTAVPEPTPLPTATPKPAPVIQPVAAAAPVATPTSSAPASDQEEAALVANGAEVFYTTCARCHGETGAGTFQGPVLYQTAQQFTFDSLRGELVDGHRVTFGFSGTLTPDQIDSVVAYVLRL